MPLESLSQPFNPDEPGRKLREVQVEHEEEPKSAAEEKYLALKASGFYDQRDQAWNGTIGSDSQNPMDQLLGVVALAEFDLQAAADEYQQLKKSKFYSESGEWLWANGTPEAEGRLLEIAVDCSFQKEKVAEKYAQFLKSCQERNEEDLLPKNLETAKWVEIMVELTHIYIQSFLNKKEAVARYKALRAIESVDKETGIWFLSQHTDEEEVQVNSLDNLMTVFVELQLGFPGAKERYEGLKKTRLFDAATQTWNDAISESVGDEEKYAFDQLLSVIIEARLEKMHGGAGTKLPTSKNIPEERNF